VRQFVVEVWGDFACFTRPEAKVERLSYQVMTPSAARGILDAIYAKPQEFSWRIDQIEVLNPIQFIPLRRNEVKDKISANEVKKAMKGGDLAPIIVDGTKEMLGTDAKGRTQRQTIALKDVRYRITAHIEPREGFPGRLSDLENQAQRRIEKGKCYYQPYLGCKEFVAYFEFSDNTRKPIQKDLEIGWMVFDVFDLDRIDGRPYISLFWAVLQNGVLKVPDWNSNLVRKPPQRR